MENIESKIKGAIFGFAVGDALGCTTEFMTQEDISKMFGPRGHREIIGGGHYGWRKGETTDDTDMMICVAEACLKNAESISDVNSNTVFNKILNDCCTNFVSWYKSNPKDIGASCREVIQKSMFEKWWRKWRKNSQIVQELHAREALGNGGLMRCLVPVLLGVVSGDRRWIELAASQSSITHANDCCESSVFEYARIFKFIKEGRTAGVYGSYKSSGHVRDAVENASDAVWLHSCGLSFEDILIRIVNRGGDADTIAALVGGVVGFASGFEAIPKRWLTALDSDVFTRLDHLSVVVAGLLGGLPN